MNGRERDQEKNADESRDMMCVVGTDRVVNEWMQMWMDGSATLRRKSC